MPRTLYLIFLSKDCANGCVWAIQDKLVFHIARWISRADTSDTKLCLFYLNNDTEVCSQRILLTNAFSLSCSPDAKGKAVCAIKSNWLKIAEWHCFLSACVLSMQPRVCSQSQTASLSKQKIRGSNGFCLTFVKVKRTWGCFLGFFSHPLPPGKKHSHRPTFPLYKEFTLFFLFLFFLMLCVLYITVKAPDIWRTEKGH